MRAAIVQMAAIAASLGLKRLSLGVHDAVTAAVSALPNARCRTTVYLDEKACYAIDSVEANVDGVVVVAQASGRPATEAELAATDESGWREHREAYRARSVR